MDCENKKPALRLIIALLWSHVFADGEHTFFSFSYLCVNHGWRHWGHISADNADNNLEMSIIFIIHI